MKKELKKKLENKEKTLIDYNWIIKITILAFMISLSFSFLSEVIISNVSILVCIIILLVFIVIGILFDMVGVAVTSASIKPFHAMCSKKIKSAKIAVRLKNNADKVASFCNDVIGDICGVVSGTVGASISILVSSITNIPIIITTLLITALIASLTIGGKAIFKSIAINKSNEILYNFAKILDLFIKDK